VKKQVKAPSPGEEDRWVDMTGEEEVAVGGAGTIADGQALPAAGK
jgi:hypothetical protein